LRNTLGRRMRNVGELERVEKEEKREKRDWWDKECRNMKREVRKELRRWKKDGGKGEKYKELRKKDIRNIVR